MVIFSFVIYIQTMNAFIMGIVFGLTITISFGPGFIALFQTSINRGLNAGFILATGMLLSDILLVLFSYFGLSELIPQGDYKVMGIIAGIILIIMGSISIFKRPLLPLDQEKTIGLQNNRFAILVKGFLLNIANPFSLIFWIGIVGFAAKSWGLHSQNVFLFFSGVFVTAFSTDLMKCYLSGLLRNVLASNALFWINKAMGFVFIGVGFYLVFKVQ